MLEEKNIKHQQYEIERKMKTFFCLQQLLKISKLNLQSNLIYLSNSLFEKLLFSQKWIFRFFILLFIWEIVKGFLQFNDNCTNPKKDFRPMWKKGLTLFFAPQSQVLDILKSFTYFECCCCVVEDEKKVCNDSLLFATLFTIHTYYD